MFDMPFGMAPVPPAFEPVDEKPPPPPDLPSEPVRAVRLACPSAAFGPGAPPLHALFR